MSDIANVSQPLRLGRRLEHQVPVVKDFPEHRLLQGDIQDPGHGHCRQVRVEHTMDPEHPHVGYNESVHVRDMGLPKPKAQQVEPNKHRDPEETARHDHENERRNAQGHHAYPR